ncbi:MAG: inositol monophosphatase family protein [Gammaproteobacteria bacterium]
MHPMLNIAIRAARKAGDIIIRNLDRAQGLDLGVKGHNDFVTEVDRLAERAIIEIIHKAYPDHAILAEESGAQGDGVYQWIIDPLDGTTNFVHGYPHFGVSIALKHRSDLKQAVVYDPVRQELFTATRGEGALVNDKRIRVSGRSGLKHALIGTGFPVREHTLLEAYLQSFRELFQDSAGIRRAGAACLDLAHVASGRLDGFWELGLQEWDIAAGVLLIQEAGGIVSDFRGGQEFVRSATLVAGNPQVHGAMREILKDSELARLAERRLARG